MTTARLLQRPQSRPPLFVSFNVAAVRALASLCSSPILHVF